MSNYSYDDALKPVTTALGPRRLQSLTKAGLDLLVEKLPTAGSRQGQGWSPRTVTLTLTVLASALDDAMAQGLVTRKVARMVRRPRRAARPAQTRTTDQVATFLSRVPDDRLYAAWLLSLMGLRRGEVFGLRWDDIDTTRRLLEVRQTRVAVEAGRVRLSEPKTHRGKRQLPLSPAVVDSLRLLRLRQADEAAQASTAYDCSGTSSSTSSVVRSTLSGSATTSTGSARRRDSPGSACTTYGTPP